MRIKICCIRDVAEARMALEHGADALGLVSAMPSGPGPIAEDEIARIAAAIPPPYATFLLTARRRAGEIVAQQRRCGVNTIQLVDEVPADEFADLRAALPGIKLVQVIHVRGDASLAEALAVAPLVDALLLDSGNPAAPVKELGGTGRVHDWGVSAQIVAQAPVPVFLAGGLNAGNVAEAVRQVRPFGLDVCSGVRTGGRLDHERLAAFVRAARTAIA